jgi:hypothetical protein
VAFQDTVLSSLLHTLSRFCIIYLIQGQLQADGAVLVGPEALSLPLGSWQVMWSHLCVCHVYICNNTVLYILVSVRLSVN